MENPLLTEIDNSRLRELVRRRLIQTGWRDSVKSRCLRELESASRESKDVSSITPQFIFTSMKPYAMEVMPYRVKSELHEVLREMVSLQPDSDKIRTHS